MLGSPSVSLLARKRADVKAHRRPSSIRTREAHDLVLPFGALSQLLPITTVRWIEAIQPAPLGLYPCCESGASTTTAPSQRMVSGMEATNSAVASISVLNLDGPGPGPGLGELAVAHAMT